MNRSRRRTNDAEDEPNNVETPPRSMLGANLEPNAGFQEAVQETEEMAKKRKTMIEHRNRIKHIYEFWIDKCPEHAHADDTKEKLLGIVELTEEQKRVRSTFHCKNTHDLVHEGTNIKCVKAFLGQKKKKENGKTCSHANIRKHHDAMLFGAEKARITLSPLCLSEMKKFLLTFKKENGQVLQLHWQFGDAGDCYAGRMLAGLDHEDPSFEVLAPHFACGMENEHVAEPPPTTTCAIEGCTFGTVVHADHKCMCANERSV
jgi:hypothetical protein